PGQGVGSDARAEQGVRATSSIRQRAGRGGAEVLRQAHPHGGSRRRRPQQPGRGPMSARSLGLVVTVLALAWPAAAQDDPDRGTDDVPARVLLDSERPIVVTVTRGGAPAPDVGLTLSWSAPRRGA